MSAPAHRIAHGEPAALPAGDAAWRVVAGRVEVYLVTPARRRLVAIVEAGGYLFPLPGGSAAALGLIAPGGATIEPGPDATDAELWESAGAWVRRAARPLGLAVADDLLAGPIVPAVQRFTLALDAHHHAAEERRDAEDLARLAVDPAAAGRATSGGGGIRRAIERAGAALGLAARRIEPGGRVPDFSAVPQLARAAGFRARRVVLPNGWWLADMGPLIVRPADQEGAQALVWRRGHYQDADGANVDEAVAAALDAGGYIAYPPLPEKVDGFVSLGRHVLAGIGGDMRVIALAGFAVALIGLIVPIATAGIFEDIVPAGAAGLLISVGIALVVAALLQALLGVAEALALARIEGRSSVRLAAGLTDRTLQLPASFFKTLAAGDLNQRIQSVEAMRALVVGIVLSSGLTALFSVVYLTLLFVRDARLALLALAVSLVYVAALFVSRMLQVGPLREAAAIDGKLAGVIHETLEGIAKLRTAAAEPRAMARWRTLYVREQGVAMKGGRVANRFAAFADAWQIVTLGSLFAAAAILSRSNLSAGQFLGFLTAFAIFQSSFVAFCEAVMQLMTAQPLAERARPLLTAPLESQAGRVDPGKLSGLIEAAGVSFGYAGEGAPLLSGLSFTLRPGEHMAIVGGSGSGKSTVLRLLLGFEAPRTGAILYDGQDLAGLDPASVRTQIGVVLQSSRLFAGSILENIRGASDLTLEQCLAAAERAGLAGDLAQLPMGVHTPITEGAGTLSGGQRQRILIARAIASEPTILFLDEATSALDNLTQAVVAETIDTMRVARVTIAHRLSTVRNADRICVLAGGRFVETGRYEELIARGGLFAELAQRQLMED